MLTLLHQVIPKVFLNFLSVYTFNFIKSYPLSPPGRLPLTLPFSLYNRLMNDNIDPCYKCTKVLPGTIDRNKLIKCNTCSKNIHIKCNKTTKKKMDYVLNHLDEFDCRSCLTCNLCQKLVAGNHRGILCDLCNKWVHAKCNKLEQRDFQKFQDDNSLHFLCSLCLRDTLPTLYLNEFHLTMKGIIYSENLDINNITLT